MRIPWAFPLSIGASKMRFLIMTMEFLSVSAFVVLMIYIALFAGGGGM